MSSALRIVGHGAVTSVGLSSFQTWAAISAAVSGFADTEFFERTPEPRPIVGAAVPFNPPVEADNLFDRLVRMSLCALRDCIEAARGAMSSPAVLLCIREPFRSHPDLDGREQELLAALAAGLGMRFHPCSAVLADGNAGALRALAQARTLLAEHRVKLCIVGGVDSYINEYDLARFEDAFRLKQKGVARGFIPGEGAAFIALRSGRGEPRGSAEVCGVGTATEDQAATVLGDGAPTGRGLHRALQAALVDSGESESAVDFRVSDMNGEDYRGMESVIAQSRFYRSPRETLDMWLPASCVGEIGAASAPLLVIVAAMFLRRVAPGRIGVCEASSDAGLRAACVVRAPLV